MRGLTIAVALAACFGALQHLCGWFLVVGFSRRTRCSKAGQKADRCPGISVLKPLHGNEPLLEQALASFCDQHYPTLQIVFGVQHASDPALAVARRLAKRFTERDIAVVVDPTPHGANRKVANLINMLPHAKHGIVLIADSDVHAPPDFLARVAAALTRPGAGLVTALYYGLPAATAPAPRLGATQITHALMPGVLLGRALGRQDCLGAAMALRRETLEAVGGLAALGDHLADDAVLGMLVRARGFRVELADTVLGTTVGEPTLAALWRHELRWARTMGALAPVCYALSIVQYPVFWAALAMVLTGPGLWSVALFAAAWTVRAAAARGIDTALGLAASAPVWLLPLRDLMSSVLILASFASDRVEWRGHVLRADRPGRRLRPSLCRGPSNANPERGEIAPR